MLSVLEERNTHGERQKQKRRRHKAILMLVAGSFLLKVNECGLQVDKSPHALPKVQVFSIVLSTVEHERLHKSVIWPPLC
jgi:hypothetical protein